MIMFCSVHKHEANPASDKTSNFFFLVILKIAGTAEAHLKWVWGGGNRYKKENKNMAGTSF